MSKVFKFAEGKNENRRFELAVYKTDDEDIAVVIHTKRLIDKQKRHVLESTVTYGYETTAILFEMLNLLFSDPDFKRETNRLAGKIEKKRWRIGTNIAH